MKKGNIRMIMCFSMIILAVVISYKIPHDSYSLIQYCIKPIRNENSIVNLSGIVPLILIVLGLKGILGIESFKKKNKLMILLLIIVFVLPFMNWTLDFTRTSYNTLKNVGIKSLDIKKSDILLNSVNDITTIHISLEIKDYSRHPHKFRIRVYLPKSLSDYTGKEFYEFQDDYVTYGYSNNLNVHKQISVDNTEKPDNYLDKDWYHEDFKYELYNDTETVKIIEHGSLF